MHLVLINPNTTQAFTEEMVALASADVPTDVAVAGLTARFGAPLLTSAAQYEEAGEAVLALTEELKGADAVVVAAFGDPGRDRLAERLSIPVIGLAEASFEIATGCVSGRFSVATTMGDLGSRIEALACQHGHGTRLASVHVTHGDPTALVADRPALIDALADAGTAAVREDGAEAIIVGGGPLASTVPALAQRLSVPVISPIAAAVSVAVQRARTSVG
ncbi:MAG: aspartate/glutamate racemase family protein [Pseudomonadota bacterium]